MSVNLLFWFSQLAGDVIMVHRGNCRFTAKANFAEAAGASAVLIINNQKGNYIVSYLMSVQLPRLTEKKKLLS